DHTLVGFRAIGAIAILPRVADAVSAGRRRSSLAVSIPVADIHQGAGISVVALRAGKRRRVGTRARIHVADIIPPLISVVAVAGGRAGATAQVIDADTVLIAAGLGAGSTVILADLGISGDTFLVRAGVAHCARITVVARGVVGWMSAIALAVALVIGADIAV